MPQIATDLESSLIVEIRRGHDTQVKAIANLTDAVNALTKMHSYFVAGILFLASISIMGLMATRGVDPRVVAQAAASVMPAAPVPAASTALAAPVAP